jgi:hypothetical protein
MPNPNPKPPEPKYSGIRKDKMVTCFKGSGGCTVIKLWEAAELSRFHDEVLAQATKEINAILSTLEKDNKDPDRCPSFIEFQNRHFPGLGLP